jgi:hypothetical protein
MGGHFSFNCGLGEAGERPYKSGRLGRAKPGKPVKSKI